LDNYNELLGILSQFEVKNLQGEGVSQVLKNLNSKLGEFLKMYDNDGNGEVDVGELVEKRKILTDDLNKGKEEQLGKERSEV
jgi:Ca2+-binding EF-hand superfamily protein